MEIISNSLPLTESGERISLIKSWIKSVAFITHVIRMLIYDLIRQQNQAVKVLQVEGSL